jgi:hypothetical protein
MEGFKRFLDYVRIGAIQYRGTPLNVTTFPVPKHHLVPTLSAWFAYRKAMLRPGQRWTPDNDYESLIWIDEAAGRVKYAIIRANTALGAYDTNYKPLNDALNSWTSFVNAENTKAGPGMKNSFTSAPPGGQGSGAWVFVTTQAKLLAGAVTGMLSSGGFAFLILILSTGNPYLSFLSIFNIVGVVSCILGSMFCWVGNWVSSRACRSRYWWVSVWIILRAPHRDRQTRVKDASVEMSVTVFGGAITSLVMCMWCAWLVMCLLRSLSAPWCYLFGVLCFLLCIFGCHLTIFVVSAGALSFIMCELRFLVYYVFFAM